MKVLVCGGRNLRDERGVFAFLDDMQEYQAAGGDPLISCVVTGAASGADQIAERWARSREIAYRGHPAPWHTHGEWCRCPHKGLAICKGAGMWRNQEMLRREHVRGFPVGLCIAFPGGSGTAGMVRLCREAGIPVQDVTL